MWLRKEQFIKITHFEGKASLFQYPPKYNGDIFSNVILRCRRWELVLVTLWCPESVHWPLLGQLSSSGRLHSRQRHCWVSKQMPRKGDRNRFYYYIHAYL